MFRLGKNSDIITIIVNGDVVLAQSLLKQPQRSCHDTQKSYTQKSYTQKSV
jgi:hypothetical protein